MSEDHSNTTEDLPWHSSAYLIVKAAYCDMDEVQCECKVYTLLGLLHYDGERISPI